MVTYMPRVTQVPRLGLKNPSMPRKSIPDKYLPPKKRKHDVTYTEENCCDLPRKPCKLDVKSCVSNDARAVMLKGRFADIIAKKQQENGYVNENGARKVAEEYKLAAKAEGRKEIQKKREASRKALEKMKKTVDIEDNFKVQADYEQLIGLPISFSNLRYIGSRVYGWRVPVPYERI